MVLLDEHPPSELLALVQALTWVQRPLSQFQVQLLLQRPSERARVVYHRWQHSVSLPGVPVDDEDALGLPWPSSPGVADLCRGSLVAHRRRVRQRGHRSCLSSSIACLLSNWWASFPSLSCLFLDEQSATSGRHRSSIASQRRSGWSVVVRRNRGR